MKRIKKNHDNKDRVIYITESGKHGFYYQPVGTNQRLWLFDTKKFSPSIFYFFRDHGNVDGMGFSLTVKQLYEKGNISNVKIRKIIDRIPPQVDYVLSEIAEDINIPEMPSYYCSDYCDFDRAA